MKFLKYIVLTVVLIGLVACGGSSSSPSNQAPTVNAGKDVTVEYNQEITFKGTAKDSDGTIESYVWKKGSKVLSKKASFKYTPTKEGKETLILTVTDNDGATASDSMIINVAINFSKAFITRWEVPKYDKSITIPTKGSGYGYSVDWGDGSIETDIRGNKNHTYKKEGTYSVKIIGDFPRIHFRSIADSIDPYDRIKSVTQWGNNKWTSMEEAFCSCRSYRCS